ncbi:MAG: hypothetical protein Q4Q22_06750 [Methanosphaera sp.]|nr:hypothetical protein [Methanosphaera sp.]
MEEKNMIIAMVLSFLFYLGNVYNGLTTRGAVEFVIGLFLNALYYFVSSTLGILVFIWWIYVLYDTYKCNEAINNNQAIPLFLTQIDLQ